MMGTNSNPEKILQSSVAMTVTLISFGMLFASLFLGYVLVRFNSPSWPPVEVQDLPQLLPLFSSVVMALSSVTYYLMEKKTEKRNFYWFLTLTLGFVFLILQWNLWGALKARGILVANGSVSSMVYAFSWIHAAHILMGIGALLWLGYYIFKRKEKLTDIKMMNVGKFWHFLGIIWLMMHLMLFVL